MKLYIFLIALVMCCFVSYQLGSSSRDDEVIQLMDTAYYDSIDIEELGEEVKKCRGLSSEAE